MKKKKAVPNISTATPTRAPNPVYIRLEYNRYAQTKQNRIGVMGYRGTLKGRLTFGSFILKTNSAIPIDRKKNQNTGAVNSTIDSNPFLVVAPITINSN